MTSMEMIISNMCDVGMSKTWSKLLLGEQTPIQTPILRYNNRYVCIFCVPDVWSNKTMRDSIKYQKTPL